MQASTLTFDYIGSSSFPSMQVAPLDSSDLELSLDLGLGLGLPSARKPEEFGGKEVEADHRLAGSSTNPSISPLPPASSSPSPSSSSSSSSSAVKAGVKRGYSEAKIKSNEICSEKIGEEITNSDAAAAAAAAAALPSKGQVIGWPPVRYCRRHALTKPSEMFVKVNMDGIAVGRKVDLNAYSSYEGLLRGLEEMFQPIAAQVPFQGRENDRKNFLTFNGLGFVLTYEDKDGDWMMVGDVPWSMFIANVRRLRITRGTETNSSVPRL